MSQYVNHHVSKGVIFRIIPWMCISDTMKILILLVLTFCAVLVFNSNAVSGNVESQSLQVYPYLISEPVTDSIDNLFRAVLSVYQSCIIAIRKFILEELEFARNENAQNMVNAAEVELWYKWKLWRADSMRRTSRYGGTLREMIEYMQYEVSEINKNVEFIIEYLNALADGSVPPSEEMPAETVQIIVKTWTDLQFGINKLTQDMDVFRSYIFMKIESLKSRYGEGTVEFHAALKIVYHEVETRSVYWLKNVGPAFSKALTLPRALYYIVNLQTFYAEWSTILDLPAEATVVEFLIQCTNLTNTTYNAVQAHITLSTYMRMRTDAWPYLGLIWQDSANVKRFVDRGFKRIESFVRNSLSRIQERIQTENFDGANSEMQNIKMQVESDVKVLIDFTETPFRRIYDAANTAGSLFETYATDLRYTDAFQQLLSYLVERGFVISWGANEFAPIDERVAVVESESTTSDEYSSTTTYSRNDFRGIAIENDSGNDEKFTQPFTSAYHLILHDQLLRNIIVIYRDLLIELRNSLPRNNASKIVLSDLREDAIFFVNAYQYLRLYVSQSGLFIDWIPVSSDREYMDLLYRLNVDIKRRLDILSYRVASTFQRALDYRDLVNSNLQPTSDSVAAPENEMRTQTVNPENVENVRQTDARNSTTEPTSEGQNQDASAIPNSIPLSSRGLDEDHGKGKIIQPLSVKPEILPSEAPVVQNTNRENIMPEEVQNSNLEPTSEMQNQVEPTVLTSVPISSRDIGGDYGKGKTALPEEIKFETSPTENPVVKRTNEEYVEPSEEQNSYVKPILEFPNQIKPAIQYPTNVPFEGLVEDYGKGRGAQAMLIKPKISLAEKPAVENTYQENIEPTTGQNLNVEPTSEMANQVEPIIQNPIRISLRDIDEDHGKGKTALPEKIKSKISLTENPVVESTNEEYVVPTEAQNVYAKPTSDLLNQVKPTIQYPTQVSSKGLVEDDGKGKGAQSVLVKPNISVAEKPAVEDTYQENIEPTVGQNFNVEPTLEMQNQVEPTIQNPIHIPSRGTGENYGKRRTALPEKVKSEISPTENPVVESTNEEYVEPTQVQNSYAKPISELPNQVKPITQYPTQASFEGPIEDYGKGRRAQLMQVKPNISVTEKPAIENTYQENIEPTVGQNFNEETSSMVQNQVEPINQNPMSISSRDLGENHGDVQPTQVKPEIYPTENPVIESTDQENVVAAMPKPSKKVVPSPFILFEKSMPRENGKIPRFSTPISAYSEPLASPTTPTQNIQYVEPTTPFNEESVVTSPSEENVMVKPKVINLTQPSTGNLNEENFGKPRDMSGSYPFNQAVANPTSAANLHPNTVSEVPEMQVMNEEPGEELPESLKEEHPVFGTNEPVNMQGVQNEVPVEEVENQNLVTDSGIENTSQMENSTMNQPYESGSLSSSGDELNGNGPALIEEDGEEIAAALELISQVHKPVDLNYDGVPDVILLNQENTNSQFSGTEDNLFAPSITPNDFNGDGIPDSQSTTTLASNTEEMYTNESTFSSSSINPLDGSASQPGVISTATNHEKSQINKNEVHTIDLTSDGVVDLTLENSTNQLSNEDTSFIVLGDTNPNDGVRTNTIVQTTTNTQQFSTIMNYILGEEG